MIAGTMRAALPLLLVLHVLAPPAARAEEPPRIYAVHLARDLTIIGIAAAGWATPQFFLDDLVSPSCPCRSTSINAFDRFATGRHATAARIGSDIAVGGMTVMPFVLNAIDLGLAADARRVWLDDTLVMGQAILIGGALNQGAKLLVRRPRPLLTDRPAGDPELANPDNYLSFYSAHTSIAFAAGMAYATTFSLRHPDSASRYAVYGAAAVAGGTIGLLRMLAGKHYPTDVLAGAVVGAGVGIVVPRLHRLHPGVTAVPMPLPGGLGVTVLARLR